MKAGDRILGVINVESEQADAFSEHDERLLVTFASQLATAIERARLFEQVQLLAVTDELTGLHNRRHFFHNARLEFGRARRFDHPLAAIILDIDHFKSVNDRYGHPLGDTVLREVARRCKNALREVDLLGRYGGEEFAVVLPEAGNEEACAVAERLRAVIADAPFPTPSGPLALTISLGVAAMSPSIPDFDALLQRADEALLSAKAAGRNRVMCK
jgi:diguanylate cyclase (GGDEF)-like protein